METRTCPVGLRPVGLRRLSHPGKRRGDNIISTPTFATKKNANNRKSHLYHGFPYIVVPNPKEGREEIIISNPNCTTKITQKNGNPNMFRPSPSNVLPPEEGGGGAVQFQPRY